jgi:hypothetical protein
MLSTATNWTVSLSILLLAAGAAAQPDLSTVDPACHKELTERFATVQNGGDLDGWNDTRSAIMLNHPALSLLVSPLAAPKQKGATLSLEIAVMPPLGCMDRVVWFAGKMKTEDTNKVPVLPRPRLRVSLPQLAGFDSALGLAYVPPVPLGATQVHQVGFDLTVSRSLSPQLDVGLRWHAAVTKVADDIAHKTNPDAADVLDFYVNGLSGVGLALGYHGGALPQDLTAYASGGYTNVGTFFLIGDDAAIRNNAFPYRGLDYTLGVQYRKGIFDGALEWHHAVGSTMKTVRARIGYAFGG